AGWPESTPEPRPQLLARAGEPPRQQQGSPRQLMRRPIVLRGNPAFIARPAEEGARAAGPTTRCGALRGPRLAHVRLEVRAPAPSRAAGRAPTGVPGSPGTPRGSHSRS